MRQAGLIAGCLLRRCRCSRRAPAPAPLQRLEASIQRTTRSINATWGIYVKSLETGEEIAIDADRQMETMSTIKIPLMVEVFEQIKAGRFKLTDKYTFVAADSQPGTGTIQRLDPGAVMTVKDLDHDDDRRLGQHRDRSVVSMVGGPDAVNARLDALGPQEDARDERAVAVVSRAAARRRPPNSSTARASIRSASRRRARWAGCSR